MLWAGDESQTGLTKTKNCSQKYFVRKNIFHNKLRYLHMILVNSCSITDVHAYPERKQYNFYYNIKTGIHRK